MERSDMRPRHVAGILVVPVLLAGVVLLPTSSALACSCGKGDPRSLVGAADAAFIGEAIRRRQVEPDPTDGFPIDAVVTFQVEERLKGDLGQHVDVGMLASCGVYAPEGERIGLALRTQPDGSHVSHTCMQEGLEALRRAAGPPPEPDGQGPPASFLWGRWGEFRAAALDEAGRLLSLGRGRGAVVAVSVCPGGARAVEVARDDRGTRGDRLVVRDLGTLEVVESHPLRGRSRGRVEALCSAGEGAALVARSVDRRATVERLEAGRPAELMSRERARVAAVVDRTVYLVAGPRPPSLVALNVEERSTRYLARLPVGIERLVPSPGGRRLAGVTGRAAGRHPTLVVVDQGSSRIQERRLKVPPPLSVVWLDEDRLALLRAGRGVRVLDASLTPLTEWRSGLSTPSAVGVEGILFAFGETLRWFDPLTGRRGRTPAGLPDWRVRSVHVLPEAVSALLAEGAPGAEERPGREEPRPTPLVVPTVAGVAALLAAALVLVRRRRRAL
jgi:hypothetical protein